MTDEFVFRVANDTIAELRAEVERLRALVRAAYQEGYETAGGTEWEEWWTVSGAARRALEHKP